MRPRFEKASGVVYATWGTPPSSRDVPYIAVIVQAETSTGGLKLFRELAAIARDHDALTVVDAVSSLRGTSTRLPYCSQECLRGARRAGGSRPPCRQDLARWTHGR